MKVNQFKFRQGTGVATIMTAETEAEIAALEILKGLIENEEGALSRKCFTFDEGSMTIDIDKYAPVTHSRGTSRAKKPAAAKEAAATK